LHYLAVPDTGEEQALEIVGPVGGSTELPMVRAFISNQISPPNGRGEKEVFMFNRLIFR